MTNAVGLLILAKVVALQDIGRNVRDGYRVQQELDGGLVALLYSSFEDVVRRPKTGRRNWCALRCRAESTIVFSFIFAAPSSSAGMSALTPHR
jgi:hypothetical protein